jgi:hypothetical protein
MRQAVRVVSSRSSSKASASAICRKTGPTRGPSTHKAKYALRAAAMLRAGSEPGLLDEVIWWRTDDLWFWSLQALVTYVRAADERSVESVAAICGRIASRHDIRHATAT